jgi:hypothetical protein
MSSDIPRRANATNGLLAQVIAPEKDDPPLSIEQRDEAMRQYRIEVASQLPLEELLEIIAMRFEKDLKFRTGVRNISRNQGLPDKSGRRGKLSKAETYCQVQMQRHSGLLLIDAVEVVAKHYGKLPRTVKRQYEDEVRRIKEAISAKKGNTD